MLRATVGITVATHAWPSVTSTNTDLLPWLLAAALVLCGLALTVGVFTPVCSTLVGLGYAAALFTPLGREVLPRLDLTAALVSLAAAAGLALLGPGAFSVDARLFGRREIFIPAKPDNRAG